MRDIPGVDYTVKFRVWGRLYVLGFSNRPDGPGYLSGSTYYGRPILYLGFVFVMMPIILTKERRILRPGWRYFLKIPRRRHN